MQSRNILLFLVTAILSLVAAGCTRELTYERSTKAGDVERLVYKNTGFDTKVGKLDMDLGARKASVENLDSQAKALDLAAKALEVLGTVGKKVP